MNTPLLDILLQAGILTPKRLPDKELAPYLIRYPDRLQGSHFYLSTWELITKHWSTLEPEDLPKWIALHPYQPTFENLDSSTLEDLTTWGALLYMEGAV